jgi:type I restriction enzyme M protein
MATSAGVTCHGSPACQSRSGAAQGYDLNLNRYKELVHEEVEHRPPLEHLAELRAIEQEIMQGIEELEGMLR